MKRNLKEKLGCETKLLRLSIAAGLLCAILEVIMSVVTRSQALLMDSVFDMAEVLVAGAFAILLPLIYKPETEKMPYGYAQLESIFMILKGSALAVITVNLIFDSVKTMLSGGNQVDSMAVGVFELLVCAGSIVVFLILKRSNQHINSQIVTGELLSWKIDIFCCLGVGMAFLSQLFLKHTPLAGIGVYVDQIVAIVMAVLLLPQPLKIVANSLRSIILLAPKAEDVELIKQTAEEAFMGTEAEITYCDCVQTGRKIWVDIYMKSGRGVLELEKLGRLRKNILSKLQKTFDDIYVEITPDLE